jgi:LacI family transcriptional regulator
MPVSLRDVAEKAGVARGTVSYVLNNRGKEARISIDTQERIRRIARELGYQPNRLAQSLGKRHSNIIGVMIPGLRNPFFLDVIETAEACALKAGFDVLPDSAFLMRSAINAQVKLAGWPVDGVLIWTRPEHTISEYLGAWSDGAPVVYLGYERDDGSDYVALDRKGGVRRLMEHLRDRGYRKISYLYPWENLQPEDSRYSVYLEICSEWGLTPDKIQLEPIVTENNLKKSDQGRNLRFPTRFFVTTILLQSVSFTVFVAWAFVFRKMLLSLASMASKKD